MYLAQPWWLALMIIPLGLIVWYWRRNRVDTVTFSNPEFMSDVMPAQKQVWRVLGLAMMLVVMFALPFVVAQPSIATSTTDNRSTVIIALDVSTSMTADDIKPSRLDAAKAAVKQAVENAPEDLNIGLVTFADNAKPVVSPTRDRTKITTALDSLKPEKGGTATGEGVFLALNTYDLFRDYAGSGTSYSCTTVVVSDGAEEIKTGERPLADAADASKAASCTISTVSYGTPNGSLNGQPLMVDPAALKAAADVTGGMSYEATTGTDLSEQLQAVQKSTGVVETQLTLPFTWAMFALGVFVLLCIAFLFLFIIDRR